MTTQRAVTSEQEDALIEKLQSTNKHLHAQLKAAQAGMGGMDADDLAILKLQSANKKLVAQLKAAQAEMGGMGKAESAKQVAQTKRINGSRIDVLQFYHKTGGTFVRLCQCGALSTLLLAVMLGLLLSGTLRDLGLTAGVDQMRLHGDQRLYGSFPILYSGPMGFEYSDIPDLSGKVAVVTGANVGLGYYTSLHLARNGAEVVMGCRSQLKCDLAAAAVKANLTDAPIPGGRVVPLIIDLSSLKSVRGFAEQLQEHLGEERGVDQLVLNAGFVAPSFRLTEDGLESSWQVNHVGHMYLYKETESLLLRAVADHGGATVTAVASAAHYGAEYVPFTLEQINDATEFRPPHRYSQTKLANVLFAMEASRLCKSDRIYINSLHPGVVNTEFLRPESIAAFLGDTLGPMLYPVAKRLINTIGWDSETAALTQLYVSASPEISEQAIKGAYFHPLAQVHAPSALATPENAKKLWAATEEIIFARTGKQARERMAI